MSQKSRTFNGIETFFFIVFLRISMNRGTHNVGLAILVATDLIVIILSHSSNCVLLDWYTIYIARVPCSNAASIGERKTWTQSAFRNSHAHSPPLFRPRLPCSYLEKSRPQPGCLAS